MGGWRVLPSESESVNERERGGDGRGVRAHRSLSKRERGEHYKKIAY